MTVFYPNFKYDILKKPLVLEHLYFLGKLSQRNQRNEHTVDQNGLGQEQVLGPATAKFHEKCTTK